MEVQRALQENSTARCPVLSAQYDGEDVSDWSANAVLHILFLSCVDLDAKYVLGDFLAILVGNIVFAHIN